MTSPSLCPPPTFGLWRNFSIFGERGCWAVPSGSTISSSTTWLLEEPCIQQAVGTGRFVALLCCFSAPPPTPGFALLDLPARSSQKRGATRGLRSWGICGVLCSGGELFAHALLPLGRDLQNIYICMHIHFICNKAKRGEEEAGAVSSWPAAPGCQSALVSSQPSGGAVGAGFPPGGHIVHRLPSQLGLQKRGMQPGVPPSPIMDV